MQDKTKLASRRNELTAVLDRQRMDEIPATITNEKDAARWQQFREAYHGAQALRNYDFPLQLDWELNSTCNLRCSFCAQSFVDFGKHELPFELFQKGIDEASEHGLVSIKLNYINEPLLRRDIGKFITYAKQKGVLNVYFATNGVFLTADKSRELIELGVNKIMVSLDAATPETFQRMRNSKQYDKIVANILEFLRIRDEEYNVPYPLLRVNFLKTKLNIHEASAFVEFWTGRADMIGLQDQVGLPGVENDVLPDSIIEIDKGLLHNDKTEFRCSFPFKMLVIDHRGQILPCCTFSGRMMPLGNLNDITLKQAWDTTRMRQLKQLQIAGKWRENSICRHCVNSNGADT